MYYIVLYYRERDNAAKLKISMASERGGIDKIIECLWENLDVRLFIYFVFICFFILNYLILYYY